MDKINKDNHNHFDKEQPKRKYRLRSNTIYYPWGCNYALVFFDNFNGYFITDKESCEKLKNHHWTADIQYNKDGSISRIDAISIIENKKVYLHRWLLNATSDTVDHINQIVADDRICNLRKCTLGENICNRKQGQGVVEHNKKGKFIIRHFSKVDTRNMEFDTKEQAEKHLCFLRQHYMGEYSYEESQKIAQRIDTHQFFEFLILGSEKLEQINSLPEKHWAKIICRNAIRNRKKELISEEREVQIIGQVINDLKAEM